MAKETRDFCPPESVPINWSEVNPYQHANLSVRSSTAPSSQSIRRPDRRGGNEFVSIAENKRLTVIPKAPRCCLYSCSDFPGNILARKATLFNVRSSESI